MRIPRRAGKIAAACVTTALLSAGGCAHSPRPVTSVVTPAPDVSPPAAAPNLAAGLQPLPALTSEEEADRTRVELDSLSPEQPRWAQLRLQLLRYYVSAAESEVEQVQLDEAFALFGSALRLFEAKELQAKAVLIPPELLALAAKLDRLYSKRGAHPQVVTALMVQLSARPGDEALRQRLAQIQQWVAHSDDGMRNLMRTRSGSLPDLLSAPPPTLESDLEQAYRLWPARVVRDELLPLYRGEAHLLATGGKKSSRDFLQSLSATLRRKGLTNSPAFKVGRAFLRASLAGEAVAAIKELGQGARLSGEEARLLMTIEETLATAPGAADEGDRLLPAVKLATTLAQNPEDA
ncbi:MAG TPA: hypothetical protein PKI03_36120, partial [Pseudomonadota bacterium]|nr:hypothetical protein [Pseudomonadota bacterium]